MQCLSKQLQSDFSRFKAESVNEAFSPPCWLASSTLNSICASHFNWSSNSPGIDHTLATTLLFWNIHSYAELVATHVCVHSWTHPFFTFVLCFFNAEILHFKLLPVQDYHIEQVRNSLFQVTNFLIFFIEFFQMFTQHQLLFP